MENVAQGKLVTSSQLWAVLRVHPCRGCSEVLPGGLGLAALPVSRQTEEQLQSPSPTGAGGGGAVTGCEPELLLPKAK